MQLYCQSTNWHARSAKLILFRILKQTCNSIRACSRLFPIADLRYVLTRFKAEKIPSLSAFVSLESKSNFTIFPTSLIKKSQFRDISCNFLIMMFITIVSFNCNINRGFLVYMFSLRFSVSQFLINLRQQFQVHKMFSCT